MISVSENLVVRMHAVLPAIPVRPCRFLLGRVWREGQVIDSSSPNLSVHRLSPSMKWAVTDLSPAMVTGIGLL